VRGPPTWLRNAGVTANRLRSAKDGTTEHHGHPWRTAPPALGQAARPDVAAEGVSMVQILARFSTCVWLVLALAGCFPCEGIAVAFPDDPIIVRGTWVGVATTTGRPDLEVVLTLDVAYASSTIYAVTGFLDLGDTQRLVVTGTGRGFCEQRFEQATTITRATPAPEMPRFEATLHAANGARVGQLLAYRIHGGDRDPDVMDGDLQLQEGATERRYSFTVARP